MIVSPHPTRVMTFGSFDMLHEGHIYYLTQSTKYGEELIVVVARDRNIFRFKGKAPHYDEATRLIHLRERFPDYTIVLGSEDDYYTSVREYRPDVLAFGYDQHYHADEIARLFPEVRQVVIDAYHPDRYKSSIIKRERGIS